MTELAFVCCLLLLPQEQNVCSQRNIYDLTSSDTVHLSLISKTNGAEHLIIYGQVRDKFTSEPISNAKLFFYQADQDGEYNSSLLGMPSYAKIRGSLKTGTNGCFKLETIVPGNYPGQVDGKHIHVIAGADGYQEWKFEFLFEGWINEGTRKEINGKAIILDLPKEGRLRVVETVIDLKKKE